MHQLVITFTSKIPFLLLHVKEQDLNFDLQVPSDHLIFKSTSFENIRIYFRISTRQMHMDTMNNQCRMLYLSGGQLSG